MIGAAAAAQVVEARSDAYVNVAIYIIRGTTAAMAWHLFGGGRDRAQAAALKERIATLQAELDNCRGLTRHRKQLRSAYGVAGAIAVLGVGFLLGMHSAPIKHVAGDAVQTIGLGGPVQDVDAGNAAYQKGKYAAAMKIMRPLADQGDARAQVTVALMYYHGRGVRQDDPEALRWFRLAGDQGDAYAQFNLGVMYGEGQGVPQDNNQAAEWYRLAADQNNAQAQYNLGLWYAEGEDGTQDLVSAHMWFNLAAARFPPSDTRNRALAVRNRDLVAGKMTRDQLAEAQKLAREWKPN
jgi:hypothetical protein